MACSSCQQRQLAQYQLSPEQLQNMPLDNVIELYRQGYRVSDNISSLALKDISTWQYLKLGVFSYLTYKSYTTKHEVWAVIFGALTLGTFSGVYGTYNRP